MSAESRPGAPTTPTRADVRSLLSEVRSELGWALAHEHTIQRSGQLWIEERIEAALDLIQEAPNAIDAYEEERLDYCVIYDPGREPHDTPETQA